MENGSAIISNCYNMGNVSSTGTAGGIASSANSFVNCYNTGSVTGTSTAVVYGIGSGSKIINCYNEGTISSVGLSVGIGSGSSDGIINCYNKGTIQASAAVGISYSYNKDVKNCYNTGSLLGSEQNYPITYSTGTASTYVENCYFLSSTQTTVYETQDTVSIPMTAAQMKASSFVTTLNNNLSSMEKINNIDFYQWKYVANSYPEFNR